ncbi:hypothetical protein MMC11_001996 [Xylographa trunciseda]|nr:hypothetical protein [Xylographa trunciseda]
MSTILSRPRVFLDVQIGTQPAGRIVIELFTDRTPKTCENFRAICTASHTSHGASKPLTYKMSHFHRIIDEFMVQGGDITAGDGTGGQSIYDGDFADENIGWREIDAAGLVCMANRGKGTNSSQFFITLAPCQYLNAKHTVFGHVVRGLDVVSRMGKLEVDGSDKPLEDVIITHCGELERRGPLPDAGPLKPKRIGHDTHTGSSERGRKRPIRSRSATPARSDSALEDQAPRRKLHKLSRSPTSRVRRRSDVEIDETRRGRVRNSHLHSNKREDTQAGDYGGRKRDKSPSRSRSRRRSPSPHLRRRHTRSRDRSPVSQRPMYSDSRRQDEYQIRREEEEREGGSGRYEGVIEDGHYLDRDPGRMSYHRQGRGPSGYNDSGGRLGGAGIEDTGGEVKFKGRGSMKYKERKR